MRCVFVLFFICGFCIAGSVELVEKQFALEEHGIRINESSEFKTVQDVGYAISENQNRIFSVYDLAYKSGMIALDTGSGVSKAVRLLEQNTGVSHTLRDKRIMGSTAFITQKLGLPSVFTLRNRIIDYVESNKKLMPGVYGVLVLLWDRPTPTGLKVASEECIKIALEDYAYALDSGASGEHMDNAAENITSALEIYSGYTGLIDAEVMFLARASPEGFGRITGLCSSAIGNIEKALSESKKEDGLGKVVVN